MQNKQNSNFKEVLNRFKKLEGQGKTTKEASSIDLPVRDQDESKTKELTPTQQKNLNLAREYIEKYRPIPTGQEEIKTNLSASLTEQSSPLNLVPFYIVEKKEITKETHQLSPGNLNTEKTLSAELVFENKIPSQNVGHRSGLKNGSQKESEAEIKERFGCVRLLTKSSSKERCSIS